jgi:hypothetical protein
MTTDYRTELQLLFDAAESFTEPALGHHRPWAAALARARALLAQPEPEGVSADEWDALVERAWDKYKTVGYQGELFMYDSDFGNALDFVRKELAPWGHPTPQCPQPVAVSERLPGPGACDEQGRCWMFGNVEGDWRLISTINPGIPKLKYCFSHWLPANALPTPTPEAS